MNDKKNIKKSLKKCTSTKKTLLPRVSRPAAPEREGHLGQITAKTKTSSSRMHPIIRFEKILVESIVKENKRTKSARICDITGSSEAVDRKEQT